MRDRLQKMLGERTLVLIKPDAVERGLVGVVCQRFEQAGLKIVACKMISATRQQLDGHFPQSDEWIKGLGEKSLTVYREYEIDPISVLGTNDPMAIGRQILERNFRYLMRGPLIALVLQGAHAVDTVRKMLGHTLPCKAVPGTIRGDFSHNAPDTASLEGLACENVAHGSATVQEAAVEIANWFSPNELRA
ncbi:MAG: nucleoside-diphosphate kinase [Patescibacteria group bacterium]|nr:nucleoside-diphosphate kinase [Patescibacteria group bacterium]